MYDSANFRKRQLFEEHIDDHIDAVAGQVEPAVKVTKLRHCRTYSLIRYAKVLGWVGFTTRVGRQIMGKAVHANSLGLGSES